MNRSHAMPFGASVLPNGGVRFRLWAPGARTVSIRLETKGTASELPMRADADGWFELTTDAAVPGSRYAYVADGGSPVPDPASRFQPDDVHGPSEVVDPASFAWADAQWRGRPWHETVLYELHAGTFTPEGSYAGIAGKLDHLVDLGVTAIELMPLSESPGRHNWGYDGVYHFAPERQYGRPDDLKALVQAAHDRNLMVFVDVVYNHFGPEGNYLHQYAPQFFTDRHKTLWGEGIYFDGPGSRAVRDFFIHNALYWIEEFGIDGLRLDAVNAIRDDSTTHILIELAETVRRSVPADRHVHLVLENGANIARYLSRDAAGQPGWYTAQWNDDIHHVLHGLTTGESGGYYVDYRDHRPARLGRALAEGFVYQGDAAVYFDNRPRGEPSGHLPPPAVGSFLQNHDQIGNRAFGERIGALADPQALRAAIAVLLLAPAVPLLFMGEEWDAAQPFPFFCDFGPDLAEAVRQGRRQEFARFPEFADEAARARIPDPIAPGTFSSGILDWAALATEPHRGWLAYYRRLLAIRHREIVSRLENLPGGAARYDVLADDVLRVSWALGDGSSLQLVANMSPRHSAKAVEIAGDLLFATTPEAAGQRPLPSLSPWFVAWFLAPDGAAP